MGESTPIQLTYATRDEAWSAYRSGLRYGVLTCANEEDLEPGQRVLVDIQLPFARWGFQVGGEVGDTTPEGVVIYLDLLPSGLVNLFAPRGRRRGFTDADSPTSVRSANTDAGLSSPDEGPPTAAKPVPIKDTDESVDVESSQAAEDAEPSGDPEPSGDFEASEDTEASVGESRGLQWKDLEDEPSQDSFSIEVEDSETDAGLAESVVAAVDGPAEPSLASVDAGESLSVLGPMEEGIPLPDLEGRSLPSTLRFAGSVGPVGWGPVLLEVVSDGLSGVMVVDCVAARYWVYFRQGFPVHLLRRPAASHNAFEAIATERKLLEPDVARRCRYLSQVMGRPYMSIVSRLRLLDEYQIKRLRQEAASRELAEMLTQIHGSFRFFSMPEIDTLFQHTPASLVGSLIRNALRGHEDLTEDRALELLRRHAEERAFPTALGQQLREQFLSDRDSQRILLKLFERDMTLAQAAQSESGEAAPLIRLVLALHDLGLAELGPEPAGAARERRLAVATLRVLHGRCSMDLFTLIGCHWSDEERVLEKALKKARQTLEAVASEEGEPRDLVAIRDEVGGSLEKAASTLLASGPRLAYRNKLVEPRARRLAAAQFAMEGAVSRCQDMRHDARARLKMVLELDPGGAGSAERTDRIRKQLQRLR